MILRSLILAVSRQQRLRSWVEDSPLCRRFTGRFIAGKTLDEGLAVCLRLQEDGILSTLDHLGENVLSTAEGASTRDAYLEAIRRIAGEGIRATVSIKLTHFGLDISEESCRSYAGTVAAAGSEHGVWVEVDMESLQYVERTLDIVTRFHEEYNSVRAVIQAYLRRSEADIERLCALRIPVRLCKGAYQEEASVAFSSRSEVAANYLKLAQILIDKGIHPAIATHDERIIREVVGMVSDRGKSPKDLEFQMLYGSSPQLQRFLLRKGFAVRLYVPYGTSWYPYFMRRLAERPSNLLFLARSLLRH